MGPVPRLAQAVLGPPGDDLDLVVDVGGDQLGQVERAGHAVDQGHRVHAEAGLQRGVLVEVVEHDVGGGVALQVDHQLGVLARGQVLDVADAVELAGVDQLLDLGGHRRHAHLVGQLGDDDLVGGLALVDLGPGPHLDGAAAGAVGVLDAGPAQDVGAGGEVGALDERHEIVGRGVGVVDDVHDGVDDLGQVVGRDVGGHAHGDALAAVDQQVGEPGGQHRGLEELARVVVGEVDGVLVDGGQQLHGQRGQPALRVARRRRLEVGRAVVAVEVDQGMAQAERLGHAHQGVVDRRVAVGVVLGHDLAGDARALDVGPVGAETLLEHRPEDPPVDGLQPVAHVGQRPLGDDREGVDEERRLHLRLELDRLHVAELEVGGRGAVVAVRHGSPSGSLRSCHSYV